MSSAVAASRRMAKAVHDREPGVLAELAAEAITRLDLANCPVCASALLVVDYKVPRIACADGCTESNVRASVYQCTLRLTGDALRGPREALLGLVTRAEQAEQARADDLSSQNSLSSRPRPPSPPDADAFYGLAGDIVAAIDPHTEADRVAILVQTLVSFGNAVGRGPHFEVEASKHYANLFATLVGETSKGRKGTSWGRVAALLGAADPQWSDTRVLSGLASGEGLIWAVRDSVLGKEGDEGVVDKRLMALEPEFARILKVASRDGNTLSTTIREAFDSGKLRTLTKNSPAVATGAHISIVGHVTRDELLRSLGETEAANGFANRFLWCFVRRSKLLPEGGGTLDASVLVNGLSSALAFCRRLGERRLERDEEARAIWRNVYAEPSRDRTGLAGAILSRAEVQTMRLALVYALLDQSTSIGVPHMRAALALWEFCERSVAYIFGSSTGDRVADEILGLLRASPGGLTRTDISANFGRHMAAGRLAVALEALKANGLISMTRETTTGRPAERWSYCERSVESEKRSDEGKAA
jgi:Protein of unknown function (DUF3987)